MNRKFYITTPIFYVNARPHIGSAYTVIAADILARFHRIKGDDVYFLTGTDENSQKNIEAAEKVKKGVKEYLDEMAAVWQETWDSLGISNDDFIRTTEERHKKAVFKFFKEAQKKGDIYEGVYEGYYCDGCEAFLAKDDLVDGKCPNHKKTPRYIREKNLFFRLTNYREKLLNHIKKHPEFIEPVSRRNEVISYIKDFMTDFSVSREKVEWGIPVPGDEKRAIYVWFDALINYISAVGYGTDEKKFKKWWPADLHLVGKDIIKFHCAYWPAMLMSAGLPLPKKLFAHGFFTVGGQKMSKSLGNIVDPAEISKKYGTDALRYFLIREIKFGEDGDFSLRRLEEVYNSELANELGNLVNRVLVMTEKYFGGKVPKHTKLQIGYKFYEKTMKDYEEAMERLMLHDTVEAILSLVRYCNQLIDKEKPWGLFKSDKKRLSDVMYQLLDSLRLLGWMLWPVTPVAAEKIWEQLGILASEKKKKWEKGSKAGELKSGTKIKKGETLFPKII